VAAVVATATSLTAAAPVLAATRKAPSLRTLFGTSPVSSSVLAARALRSGSLTLPNRTAPAAPGITVLPNVKASNDGSQPVNEVPIAVDPNNANHLLTGGNDYNCSSLAGFFSSDNGGTTWPHQHCAPVVGAGGCGDPNVAYDGNGNGYIATISNCNGSTGSLLLQKTPDNGVTWGAASIVVTSILGGLTDKEWLEIDTHPASPHYNCLYFSWTDFNASFTQTRVSVAHSCDGGVTWSKVPADTTQTVPSIDQFSDLSIAADGTVYLTWMQCHSSGSSGDCGGTSVSEYVSKSTDGGTTWSSKVKIADVTLPPDTSGCYYGCFPGTAERLADLPSNDYDDSTGTLWAGYFDYTGGKTRAMLAKSTNGGTTWTTATVTPASANTGYIWVASNDAGKVAESYLGSVSTGTFREAASLTQNGTSFQFKVLATANSQWSNDGFGGGFIGDYTGGVWSDASHLHTSFMDTRSGGVSSDMTGGVSIP